MDLHKNLLYYRIMMNLCQPKNGNNKVEVILLEAESLYCDIVIERIINNWKENEPVGLFDIDYEMEIIK